MKHSPNTLKIFNKMYVQVCDKLISRPMLNVRFNIMCYLQFNHNSLNRKEHQHLGQVSTSHYKYMYVHLYEVAMAQIST